MKFKIPAHISVNKVIQLLLLFLFILNISDSLFVPIFAVYVKEYIAAATLSTVGFATAVFALAKSIVQIPIAKRLDAKKGEKDDFFVMAASSIIGVIYPIALIYISHVWQLYLLQVFVGIGTACLMAAYYSIFSHHIDKNQQGFEWSLFSVGGLTLSVAIGGALGGLIADAYGFAALFIGSAALNLTALLLLTWLYPYMEMESIRTKAVSK